MYQDTSIRMLVEEDQVECIETSEIAFSDDLDVQNDFAFLLRRCVQDQYHRILSSHREDRDVLYFSAPAEYESREYKYQSFENKTKAEVVMVNPGGPKKRSFVRHHAISTRFYLFGHENGVWYLTRLMSLPKTAILLCLDTKIYCREKSAWKQMLAYEE